MSFLKKDGIITKVERTLTRLYEEPIKYFNSLPQDVKDKLPKGYRIGFRYYHSKEQDLIVYDRLPINGLILTDLKRLSTGKVIDDLSILNGLSDLLRVQSPPVIWYGELDGAQKTRILDFIKTPEDQLQKKFKTTSFTRYVMAMLNPDVKKTALQNDVDKPIDSIVFKFLTDDGKKVVNAKLVDPVVYQMNSNVEAGREPQDLYGIILSDIVEFIKINGLRKYAIKSTNPDEKMLELCSKIFLDYIKKMGYKYEGIEIKPLDFANEPKFDINYDLIGSEKTKEKIKESSIFKHIFRIIVSGLNKPKKRASGTLTKMLLVDLKEISDKAKAKVNDGVIEEADSMITFEEYMKRKTENSWTIKD
jgi:hypothetical protein